MKKVLAFAILLVICQMPVLAQSFEGIVKDAKTGMPVSYANVGIVGKGIGTVTDDSGHFKLSLNSTGTDVLKISIIGYQSRQFTIVDFIKNYSPNQVITLLPVTIQLNEVKIHAGKLKEKVLGNTTKSQSIDAGFDGNLLGNEIGIIIKIKKSPTYIRQFNASLAHASTDSIKLRLNFYSVKHGLPDTILLHQNILVAVKKGETVISVDLKSYNIVVQGDFFVSLESIQNTPGHGLMFSASLFSSPIITRETSQANWEKIGIGGIGFNVLAAY